MLIQRFTPIFTGLLFLLTGTLFSQSATFSMPDLSGNTGDVVCVPITVADFSDVVEFGFTISWDENALGFQNIQNINPALTGLNEISVIPGAGIEGINTFAVAGGGLTAYWRLWDESSETCDDLVNGLDLSDDAILFEICFTVLADAYGQLNPISFFNAPQPLVVNKKLGNGDCTEDAVLGTDNGSITVGVDPLILTIDVPQGNYQPNDLVCVDIVAESGFIGMQGLQFGLDWDRTVLQIESVQPNTDIPNNQAFNYNVDQANNCFAVSWAFTVNNDGVTLDPNTVFASACFRIIGDCGDQSDIDISPACNGSQVEATNSTIQTLAVVSNSDRLRINNCNNFGLDVIVDCGPTVNVGDNVCIEIEAGDNYTDIVSYNYLIRFDESVLSYTGTQNYFDFTVNAGDFDDANVANGILNVDLDHPLGAVSAAPGTVLYEVCFDVIGYAPNTPIIISDPSSVNETNPNLTLIGVDPDNCEVSINQPSQVIVSIGDVEAGTMADACVPVTVSNFENITDLSFTLQYDNTGGTLFDFINLINNAIPGATVTPLPGFILFEYSGAPITIPDGDLLFELCLRADMDATPNVCSPLDIVPFPLATTATSQDGTIDGIVRNPGEACVLFPEGFGLIIGCDTIGISSEVCVPVQVVSFDNILSAEFNINFDPSRLNYQGVFLNGNWPGFTLGNVDDTNAASGVLSFDWTSSNGATAITDSLIVFELCFNTLDEPGCFDLDGNATVSPSATTSAGDGSIVFTDGKVCVDNRIVIDSVEMIPSPCAGSCGGQLIITAFTGDPDNQDVFIRIFQGDIPRTFFQGDTIDNVCTGWNTFTLYTSDGDLQLVDSVFVTFDPTQAATADAGPDNQLSCVQGGCVLIGGNGNVGEEYILYRLNGNALNPVAGGTGMINNGSWNFCATNNGVYVVEVISAGGCSAFDTVEVFNPVLPVADAGPATLSLTCNNSPITLDGAGSSTDGVVTYLWERIVGGEIVDTLSTTLDVVIDSAGRYRLTVFFPQSQCSATDEVIVSDDRVPPNVNLADVYPLSCDGGPAMLDAGPATTNLVYLWQNSSGDIVSAASLFTTDMLDTYTVTVTDTVTGCETIDTAMVIASQGNPAIADTLDQPLNCNSDTIRLMPTFTNVSGGESYTWTTPDGGFVIGQQSQPNPLVIGLGTYTVTVDDGGCVTTATIEVVEPVFPIADAGMDMNILCGQSITIDGSSSQSTDAGYLWFTAGDTINGETMNTLTVDMPGVYVLEVRDLNTQCRSTDTIEILPAIGFPMAMLPDTVFGLNCENGSLIIDPQVNAGGDPFSLAISGPGNPVANATDIEVFEPGTYTLTVTNTNNDCEAAFTFVVDGSLIVPPFVAFTVPNITLTCLEPVATISGVLSSSGPNFDYVWNNIVAGETPNQQGNDTLMVSTAGTYTLTVINTETMCSATDTMVVQDGRSFPEVEELPFEPITCDDQNTTLSINIPDTSGLFIQWFGPPMGTPPSTLIATNVLSVDVTGPSNYTVVVVDQASSCITQVNFPVELDLQGIDNITFAPVDSFDCASTNVTIDASESLDDPSGIGIEWTSLDGNTITPPNGSLIVSVDGPGSYVLTLSTDNGCVNSDTIVVESSNDTPVADAGEDVEIECGEMPMLDGTNSSVSPDNDIFNYTWTAISGGSIVSGSDGLTPVVSGIGTYVLTVTSLINLCEDTDTVVVNLLGQEPAALPFDFSTCDDSTTVMGNLPAGTTGAWEIVNQGGADVSLLDNVATIAGLENPVTLAWTLSAPGCENYSSDTVTVSRAADPVAFDDDFVITGNNGVGTINIVDNDQPNGSFTVRLLDSVPFGEVVSFFDNGELTFNAGQGVSGSFVLNYELCNTDCGTCTEATINVRVDADGQMPPVYNTITPNGDGLNEFFVFDLLEFAPEDYPNNSIIIFNRWGDILYEAAPYNNDWDGRNQSGEELPEGTYYYILRLDLGEGDIIRGDVTILR